MNDTTIHRLLEAHRTAPRAPSHEAVARWADDLLRLLFPERAHRPAGTSAEIRERWQACCQRLERLLLPLDDRLVETPVRVLANFAAVVGDLREMLLEDAVAIESGDPAAADTAEVIRVYPGFFATAIHRIAHHFQLQHVPVLPRALAEYAHERTGIDIHPGAVIGRRFCIDHGTGIVIGETSVVGDGVKMYQGVTLGALSVRKDLARTKRHPSVEDDVVLYANATILGGETVVGRGSVIGGNAWVLSSVPPGSRVLSSAQGGIHP